MADEVDTDDELRAATQKDSVAAAEVDTDDELRKTSQADSPAYVLWGAYHPAKLKIVQQGMYQVRFDDGATRWATCGELVLADAAVPLHLLQDGMPILRPEVDSSVVDFGIDTARSGKSTARSGGSTPRVKTSQKNKKHLLVQGKLKRRVKDAAVESWEVQRDDAEGTLTTHPASELRLPVAYGLMLGSGGRLAVGARVHALRGEWRKCTLHGGGGGRASQMRGRGVTVDLGSDATVRTWVSGGQLIVDEPADVAALAPGTRCVANVPSNTLKPHVEVAIVGMDERGAFECVTDAGKQISVPAPELRTRLDIAFRVLAASAGFQRAKVVDFTPGTDHAQRAAETQAWLLRQQTTHRREISCIAPQAATASGSSLRAYLHRLPGVIARLAISL